MRIEIQASGFELIEALRQHTERRLQFALNWASREVRTVNVRLAAIDGSRGGSGKRCRIRIVLAGGQDLVVEDTEAELRVAIERAADRAGRTLARQLERLRAQPHVPIGADETLESHAAQDAALATGTD